MSKKIPPYSAVHHHPMFPEPSRDEAARFDALAQLNRYLAGPVGRGNRVAYERQALPAFRAVHGRDPIDREEVRRAMNANDWHRLWSSMKRNSMEMRQQNGRAMVLRQLDMLDAKAARYNEDAATLVLDATISQPRYQTAVDIHCMPGGYHGEERAGDVSAGANYDSGLFATTAGALGGLSDGGGRAVAAWARSARPDWQPRRILDLGCTIGHNVVPIAQAYPDAEVVAIDSAAAVLRYGHARARALGVANITFMQADAEDLSRFPDGHFDWVQTTMFLHELSARSLPRILGEAARVLAPGGLLLHVEQPQYTPDMPVFEQFMRDWDSFNNNEPFWSAMHAIDLNAEMAAQGFPAERQFRIAVKAEVDRSIFPEAPTGDVEDYGRAAAWNAYGGWKPERADTRHEMEAVA